MNTLINLVIPIIRTNPLFRRRQFSLAQSPEWWVWLFSLFVWTVLILSEILIPTSKSETYVGMILCFPSDFGQVDSIGNSLLKQPDGWTTLLSSISKGILPWILMLIAMMFPLLKRSIQHTALSIQRKDRELGILTFLLGYTLVWFIAGFFFLTIPLTINYFIENSTLSILAGGLLFLLAGFMSSLPKRKIIMMQCERTQPIRIRGFNLYKDCLYYGLTIGMACLGMCWIPMAALMLAHHSIGLMLVVSLIVLIERYYVSHDSKLISYAWYGMGIFLFVRELII